MGEVSRYAAETFNVVWWAIVGVVVFALGFLVCSTNWIQSNYKGANRKKATLQPRSNSQLFCSDWPEIIITAIR